MNEHIAKFIDHMRQCGIGPENPAEIIDDDKIRRYRLEGDKPKTRNGSYRLGVQADGFAFGWAQSFKEGITHSWHTRASRGATDAERAEWRRLAAEAKAARKAESDRVAKNAAEKSARIWDAANAGLTEYHKRKQIEAHGAKIWRDTIAVPMRKGGELVGLQFISDDGGKRFITGVAKEGSYFSIAKRADDLSKIIICEGYATGGSIRQATGWPVIVSFDAGNLKPVAQAIRKKYPDSEIIIAADNDQWTRKPDGSDWNPGIEKAHQAAVAIGGARVIAPSVPIDDPDKRTDWNDIAVSDGIETVAAAIMAEPEIVPDIEYPGDYTPEFEVPDEPDPLALIRPLGHNHGTYYFFPRESGQIVALSNGEMSKMTSLYRLAKREFWESYYGTNGGGDSKVASAASAHLIAVCHRIGVFQTESTRGVGAWIDKGRVVVNTGSTILCDGVECHPSEFDGESVYESGPKVIDLNHEPLRNVEAVRVREITRRLNWKRPMYADILAGWLVIAPVGSALSWRPHIWLTGRSGSGKSTVLDEIIKRMIGKLAILRDGGTTEAGVRKALGNSGRPFILDEAESESKMQRQTMESIVSLARRSSSGGVVENYNHSFEARSCFCFSAINPALDHTADKSRITQIELMPDVSPDRDRKFDDLLRLINEVITPDFNARFLARTVSIMPVLLENCRTFSLAASAVLGNKRAGDQIGPMIAGAYSLTSSKKISYDDAKKWMESQQWDWNFSPDDENDASKLVTHIMTSRVKYDVHGSIRESSIGEMVGMATDSGASGHDAAVNGLRNYGVKVDGDRILIANQSPQMKKLLTDTPWVPWNRTLSDYPGSDNMDGKTVYFAPGLRGKCISIPISAVLPDSLPASEEIPFEGDEL